MSTSGTGRQNVFEGLNEAQIRFLEYLNEQIKKYDNDLAGVDVQVKVIGKSKTMDLCWGPRGWYFCDIRVEKAPAK